MNLNGFKFNELFEGLSLEDYIMDCMSIETFVLKAKFHNYRPIHCCMTGLSIAVLIKRDWSTFCTKKTQQIFIKLTPFEDIGIRSCP